jgi:LytS/YehU family sensor histidine kinase
LKVIRSKNEELDIAYEKLEETKKHELAASNLKAIKSQMNPHFIFNAVNSIQDLVLQQETIKSYDYLVLFSQMVRTILDHSEREFIPLSEEVAFLNKYLGLEKLRFEEDFNFEIITDGCPQGIFIPSLIVQPFAENAIKHGLLHKDGPKKLTIRFEYKDELICFVEDNGIGETEAKAIQGNKSSQHKSFSTDAIAKRLKLLQEQTNSEAKYCSSTIYDGTEVLGTMVEITLPIKS